MNKQLKRTTLAVTGISLAGLGQAAFAGGQLGQDLGQRVGTQLSNVLGNELPQAVGSALPGGLGGAAAVTGLALVIGVQLVKRRNNKK